MFFALAVISVPQRCSANSGVRLKPGLSADSASKWRAAYKWCFGSVRHQIWRRLNKNRLIIFEKKLYFVLLFCYQYNIVHKSLRKLRLTTASSKKKNFFETLPPFFECNIFSELK